MHILSKIRKPFAILARTAQCFYSAAQQSSCSLCCYSASGSPAVSNCARTARCAPFYHCSLCCYSASGSPVVSNCKRATHCVPFYRARFTAQHCCQSFMSSTIQCTACDPCSAFNWREYMICQNNNAVLRLLAEHALSRSWWMEVYHLCVGGHMTIWIINLYYIVLMTADVHAIMTGRRHGGHGRDA